MQIVIKMFEIANVAGILNANLPKTEVVKFNLLVLHVKYCVTKGFPLT